jgi:alkanesulfonate monooxygenase SsuD/methylene tetrahydromethanopterin reductase-like flavin-dependent oxidoreductase (luciferase family)
VLKKKGGHKERIWNTRPIYTEPLRRDVVKFGLFYQMPCADTQTEAVRYQETIEQIVHADTLGFDCAWMAELHFFKHFSIMPSPLIVATAAAQRTKRIRLGTGVNLLPLYHPLRSAEDGATVDILSNGRLEFGVGRGAIPIHFAGFDVSRDISRERFEESLEIIQKAWTTNSFSYEGKHFHIPETSLAPKPLQKPHPPFRVAANSPDTAAFAGKAHYPILVASVTNPLPRMFEQVALYRRNWNESTMPTYAQAPALPDISTMFFVHPGESLAQVRQDVEPSIKNYFNSISAMMRTGVQLNNDETYRYLQEVQRGLDSFTFERVTDTVAIFGTPRECIAKAKELHKELGMNELICWFNPGGLVPHEKVLAAMSRFAAEVMPELRPL